MTITPIRPQSPETIQAQRDAVTPPNGCAVCGADKQGHAQRHGCGPNGGFGGWQEPTNRQRLDRMYARHDLRTNGNVTAAARRLFILACKPCTVCNLEPGTEAGECPTCHVQGIDLEVGHVKVRGLFAIAHGSERIGGRS